MGVYQVMSRVEKQIGQLDNRNQELKQVFVEKLSQWDSQFADENNTLAVQDDLIQTLRKDLRYLRQQKASNVY